MHKTTETTKKSENMLSFIYQFRNKVNAMFSDDKDFFILEVDEPLPDGTIEYHGEHSHTLNIVGSDMAKLTILRDYLGDKFEDGETLYIDYYFGRTMSANGFLNIYERPKVNGRIDIAMLFNGNPHFSKFYSGDSPFGPWFCVAFKPELIQYYNEDATSLHGRKSCAMEDIARDLFPHVDEDRIYFSTENIEDFSYCSTATSSLKLLTPSTGVISGISPSSLNVSSITTVK